MPKKPIAVYEHASSNRQEYSAQHAIIVKWLDQWARHGCRLTFVSDGIDCSGWMSDVMLRCFVSMRLAWAKQERQRISQRVKASIEHRRSLGKPVGSRPDQKKRNKVLRWTEKGVPVTEQATRLGISRQAVYQMRSRITKHIQQAPNALRIH